MVKADWTNILRRYKIRGMAVSLAELLSQAGIDPIKFADEHMCPRVGVVCEGVTADTPVEWVVTRARTAVGLCRDLHGGCVDGCMALAIANAAQGLEI